MNDLFNPKTSNRLIVFWSPFPQESHYLCSEIFAFCLHTDSHIQCIDYFGTPDPAGKYLLLHADLVVVTMPQNQQIFDRYFLSHQLILPRVLYLIVDYFPEVSLRIDQIRRRYRLSDLQILTLSYNRRFYDASHSNRLAHYLDQILYTAPNAEGMCLNRELKQFRQAVFHAMEFGISIVPDVKTVSNPS